MLQKYISDYVRLLRLAMPLVLTQAGQTTILLIDNAMVGHFGTAELAAVSFANNVYIVVMLLGLGVFMGITPLVGHARGAEDDCQIAATMKNGFVLSAVLIPAITLIAWAIAWIMPYLGQADEVVHLAVPYYQTLVIAIIPFLLFALLKQIGEGLGNTFAAMMATVLCILLKVILNYILIFGNLGFPKLGLMGAGYATIIARAAMPVLLFAGFLYLKPLRHYFALMQTVQAASREIIRILRIGLPIAVQMILEVSAFAFSAVMMGWMGSVPLASHEIAIGLAGFTFMIATGVSMAATIQVSYQLGNRDYKSIGQTSYSAIYLVLATMGLCGLGFLLFRNLLPYIFTTDSRVIAQAAALLAIAAAFQLFDGLQASCLGILRGFADVKIPMFISVLSYMVVGLPVSYLCAFSLKLGPEGIWYGFLAGLVAAGILLSLRIRRKIRQAKNLHGASPGQSTEPERNADLI
jgi:MATE family multidrug resistance protein